MPHPTIVKADKKAVKKRKKTNCVHSKQVMSTLKVSKKSKSNRKDEGTSPIRHANEYDKMLSAEEINFHIWFESEDDMCGATITYKSQYEDEAQNKEDDDLPNEYKSDNGDYVPLSDSNDEHPFSKIFHALGGQMFREDTRPI